MITGLLITIDIFVCIALVIVVLMQRSEGGAFGMGGGPTGLVTARGAGDLLTRTTWVLFSIFIALSLGLSLLGAHEHASSSVLERLRLQQVNPNVLTRPLAPTNVPPTEAPAPTAGLAPAPSSAETPAPAPSDEAASTPAKAHHARHAAAPPDVSLEGESPAAAPLTASPPLVAPPPKADEPAQSAPAPQP